MPLFLLLDYVFNCKTLKMSAYIKIEQDKIHVAVERKIEALVSRFMGINGRRYQEVYQYTWTFPITSKSNVLEALDAEGINYTETENLPSNNSRINSLNWGLDKPVDDVSDQNHLPNETAAIQFITQLVSERDRLQHELNQVNEKLDNIRKSFE